MRFKIKEALGLKCSILVDEERELSNISGCSLGGDNLKDNNKTYKQLYAQKYLSYESLKLLKIRRNNYGKHNENFWRKCFY